MYEVSLDIESFGLFMESTIIQIGTCLFDPLLKPKDCIMKSDTINISVYSSDIWGFSADKNTMDWWDKQSDQVKASVIGAKPAYGLSIALQRLTKLYDWDEVSGVWGNGPAFDNAKIAYAYQKVFKQQPPWSHKADNCFRTLRRTVGGEHYPRDESMLHNGEADAIAQARTITQDIQTLRKKGLFL